MEKSNLFFLILGMHRSGTSCLAGALEQCGLYLGDVRRKGKYNKKGYFELSKLQKIHDQILGLNLGSWSTPPKEIQIHSYHLDQLRIIVNEYSRKKNYGFKDPRILLLLDIWKDLFRNQYQFVGTFRHPLAVAQSLKERNKLPVEQGIQLWVDYNQKLVDEHIKKPFPLIHYDLSDIKKYRRNILKLAKELGLSSASWRLTFFISSKLENYKTQNFPLPAECMKLYSYLVDHKFR